MKSMNKKATTSTMSSFVKKFVPPEVYPLLVPVTFACGFGTYIGYRTLVGAPDVHVFGRQPRFESGHHRSDPHFAGIHSKASRFDPHPELGQAEANFHSSYASSDSNNSY
ncbi:uncharacterized protein ACA1_202670 [Acanthamoeba castellanii str. Neff]|uniref:Uncharacterized protein n=1 Tax=Acanthamoeba castellanii (strain ATCC 30010 / Neff) TaxID=1257118 RepID=L8GSV7_ACACF|nr:uncharacterized protein ACA1_202670 [Acanthamoeba castellanii str. Neff]ELR16284.1 hypothetical protein ACA1_202670 [Acanthamoeba castellanii str. Neff]